MIDISNLNNKTHNKGADESGRLAASEWNTLVSAVEELQDESYVKPATGIPTTDITDANLSKTQAEINRETGEALDGKQDTISDLAAIRSGAAAGATAIQPSALSAKQDVLVSGTNIKTINNESILGSGDLTIGGSDIDTVTVSVDSTSGNPSGGGSISGGTLSLSFSGLVGATGATGPQGQQGPKGEKGDTGATGAKGDTGLTGSRGVPGPAGVSSVNVNVSNTSGTPSGTAALNEGVLTLSLAGLKGEQGNTGSSVDYPYELVNNRITDDAAKGLSAAEGKRIGDDLYLVEEDLRGGPVSKYLTWVVGFIGEGGGVYSRTDTNTKYTQPFPLRRGEKILLTTSGSGMATISRTSQTSIAVGDLVTPVRTIPTGEVQEVTHEYLATQDINVVVCVKTDDSTFEIVKTDSVYTRLSNMEPIVAGLDKSVELMLGDVFDSLGDQSGYYTFDGENKKSYLFSNDIRHIEIPIYNALKSVKLSGFTYTPSTESASVYTRIIFYDDEDNTLGYVYELTDTINRTMFAKVPANATQCYVDVPTIHKSEVIVQINGSASNDDTEEKLHMFLGDIFDKFDAKRGYYTFDAQSKKVFYDISTIWHMEIPVDSSLTSVRLSGFSFIPGPGSADTYARIIFYDDNDNLISYMAECTDPEKSEIYLAKPQGATQCYVDVPLLHADEVFVQINSISGTTKNGGISFDKYISNVANLAYTKGSTPLVLLHFSDIHGGGDNYERLNDFAQDMEDYIDDVISTGDNVLNSWSDPFTYWTNVKMLNVIGNHDTAKFEGGLYDWTYYAGKDAYDRYFAPFIANWGVTQPTDAAANGYCYYYKDYTTQGIRLIVLDCMDWGATQLSWFASTLESARQSNLSVVIAIHYQFDGSGVTGLDTGFNSYVGWSTGTDTYTPSDAISAVDDFIAGGGKFICWIAGHTHRDYAGYLSAHHNQLCIVVGTDASDSSNITHADSARIKGTDSQDLFNVIAFDATEHQIRIVRVGSNFSKQLQSRNTLCIGYSEDGSAVPRVINQS